MKQSKMKTMIKSGFTAFCALASLTGLLTLPTAASAAPTDLDLAYRWAPIHYQDTDSSDYDADYITAVDYDGEWDTLNNWENQSTDVNRLKAKVYYSVVETSSHWYLLYSFYHPRDWVDYPDLGLDTHENDMEGVLSIVRKDGSTYGKLEGMVSVFHTDFYSYTPSGSPFTSGQESIDGTIRMVSYGGYDRPTTFQEAKGHGAKAWNGSTDSDYIVYYPSKTTAEVPSSGKDTFVSYQLVDTFAPGGLWEHRYDTKTFASWGTFRGDNGKDNAANTGWKWDDGNDGGELTGGELAVDPAKLVSIYFSNLGSFDRNYVRNGYR
ncbi:hypothetical protein [Brevibacillus dissolubilis]|uniref:hypothetical protein n=1 Tax=Brevibacillus dissolubilis TaxID=1844116 RepID=UPI0020FFFBD5|nr:hypothetical protein [Brevibacillus dissolubilis]